MLFRSVGVGHGAELALELRGVAAELRGAVEDAGERRAKVSLDVDGERFQRRDVEHAPRRIPERESVDRGEERGERLARSGRTADEGVAGIAARSTGGIARVGGVQLDAGDLLSTDVPLDVAGEADLVVFELRPVRAAYP